jgi:hypothetical protein
MAEFSTGEHFNNVWKNLVQFVSLPHCLLKFCSKEGFHGKEKVKENNCNGFCKI